MILSFQKINLKEMFDIPLETYLSPQNRQAAFQLWRTAMTTGINGFSIDLFNEKFEEFFKKFAQKYFDDLKDKMVDLIQSEFIKLKKELQNELRK